MSTPNYMKNCESNKKIPPNAKQADSKGYNKVLKSIYKKIMRQQ